MKPLRNLTSAIAFVLITLSLTLGVVSPFASSGCATVKTNPTLTEQEQARQIGAKIAKGIQNTALVLRQLQDAEIAFHNAPADRRTITDAEHRKIQGAFLIVFQQLDNSLTRVQRVTSRADLKTTVTETETALKDLADALVVSNPEASKYLKAAAEGVRLVFAVVQSLLDSLQLLPVSMQTVDSVNRYLELTFVLELGLLAGPSAAEMPEGPWIR